MSVQSTLARIGGDIWRSWKLLALWPYPAIIYGQHHTKFTWDDYRSFTRHLVPGDFILTTCEPYFLSNRGISGTAFKHLAIFTGAVKGRRNKDLSGTIDKAVSLGVKYTCTGRPEDNIFERTVTHAISEGVVCQDLGELLFHSDWACVVRPVGVDLLKTRQKIVNNALLQQGLGYNFDFTPKGPKELYCTELGSFCIDESCKRVRPPKKSLRNTNWKGIFLPLQRFKSEVLIADSFVKEFQIVCCSVSCDHKFAARSEYSDVLRTKFLSVL